MEDSIVVRCCNSVVNDVKDGTLRKKLYMEGHFMCAILILSIGLIQNVKSLLHTKAVCCSLSKYMLCDYFVSI